MGWLVWAYLVGAVVTMGAALAVEVKRHDEVRGGALVFGIPLCGLIWPVLWCAALAYAALDRK